LTSVLYTRQVLSGSFLVVNKDLQKRLTQMDLWSSAMKDRILRNQGSIQGMTEIPAEIRELFKTGWEMSKKTLIDMAADRDLYIDQSQSLNQFISDPTDDLLSSVHVYGWEQGLKTGMYYLRRKTI